MFWCCPTLDCDKNKKIPSFTSCIKPRTNSSDGTNASRLHASSPVDGSHTNPCLDDVSVSEHEVIYSRTALRFPDSPSYNSSPSPEYFRSSVSYDSGELISTVQARRDNCRQPISREVTASVQSERAPTTAVSTVASLTEKSRGLGNWWKFGFRTSNSLLQETICERVCDTDPFSCKTQQKDEQEHRLRLGPSKSSGYPCVLVCEKTSKKVTRRKRNARTSLSLPTSAAFVPDFEDDTVLLDNTALELEYASLRDASVAEQKLQGIPLKDHEAGAAALPDMEGGGPQPPAGRGQSRSTMPLNSSGPGVEGWLHEPVTVHGTSTDTNPYTQAEGTAQRTVTEQSFSQDTAFQSLREATQINQEEVCRNDQVLSARRVPSDTLFASNSSYSASNSSFAGRSNVFPGPGRSWGLNRMMSLPMEAEASLSLRENIGSDSIWQHRTGGSLQRQSSLESGGADEPSRPTLLWHSDSTTPSDDEDGQADQTKAVTPFTEVEQLNKVNEDMAELLESSDTASGKDADKIKVQCVALWQLRSTLEDEDPDSDNLKTGQTPDESSPDSDMADKPGSQEDNNVILMTPEARRTSYRAILARRLKHQEGLSGMIISSDNSFDSVDTDNSSVTDFIRHDANVSVDSAFDASVDSVPESRAPRPHQMKKTDSGYRSIEVASTSRYSMASWSQNTFEESVHHPTFSIRGTIPSSDNEEKSTEDDEMSSNKSPDEPTLEFKDKQLARSQQFHLSRKLWHSVSVEPSFMETDGPCSSKLTDPGDVSAYPCSSSALVVGRKRREMDASRNDEVSGKRSVMHRFMSPHKYSKSQLRALQRDYSIDEKSDRLFKEFSRTEPFYEMEYNSYTIPRRGRRNRRRARHLEVTECSPLSHRRKLSPQDSIEEESSMDTGRDSSMTRSEGAMAVAASPDVVPTSLWPPPPPVGGLKQPFSN
ncbi:uncharacterized protein LOC108681698 isoform X2 [Hyalella azteca]|uniref:Uncharacterized protein LOC108681698 isoform X2 n=1 Tax=Hyalella azteca TaxID=294128 RepID=A0A8B7PJ94_HYAAZ|nr:uncharacterized protein LOC108681698 isoform X2 [Hyalella azteca]